MLLEKKAGDISKLLAKEWIQVDNKKVNNLKNTIKITQIMYKESSISEVEKNGCERKESIQQRVESL